MGTKRDIYRLLEKKREIEKKIDKLREKCKHTTKSIKFVSTRPEGYQTDTRWVCEECEKILGIPAPSDLEKFLRK